VERRDSKTMEDQTHVSSTAREFISAEEAIAMLPDHEYIHTFVQAGSPGQCTLIGTEWKKAEVIKAIKEGSVELAGPMASEMKHGLVVMRSGCTALFVETGASADEVLDALAGENEEPHEELDDGTW
jgi:hypothetical protein